MTNTASTVAKVLADDPVEFDIHAVPEDFVLCRTLGHAWRRVRMFSTGSVGVMEIQCTRCKTRGHDEFDRRGSRIGNRRYDYTDGYLHKGTTVERYEYRVELFVRAEASAGPAS